MADPVSWTDDVDPNWPAPDRMATGFGDADPVFGLLDALVHPAAFLGDDGVIRSVNSAWRQAALRNGGGEIAFVGMNYLGVCDTTTGAEMTDARQVRDGLRSLLAGDRQSFNYTYACHDLARQRWYKLVASRVESMVLVLHVDVTDEYEALPAHTLADHYAQLAHDLLNPLNALLGFISLAQGTVAGSDDPARRRRHMDLAAQSAATLQEMFVDMMKSARDGGARDDQSIPDDRQTVSVKGLVRDVCSEHRAVAETVTVSVDDRLPDGLRLVASAIQIRRILQNTVSNAIKYNRPGGSVAVALTINRSGGIEFSVTDTGIGIAEEDLPRMFDKYRRLERGEQATDGFGIGLSVVRDLTHAHDGDIDVASTVGVGTTVRIMFPAWRTVAQGDGVATGCRATASLQDDAGRRRVGVDLSGSVD